MKTVIYLDELLLTNFLAAAALLLGAGLLCARQCSGLRLMAGSAAAAAASLGILLPELPGPAAFLYKVFTCCAAVAAAYGVPGLRNFVQLCVWYLLLNLLLCGAVLLPGVQSANLCVYLPLSPGRLLLCCGAVLAVLRGVLFCFGRAGTRCIAAVLELEGAVLSVQAFCDTGFSVQDPLTGQAVVLVYYPAVRSALPQELLRWKPTCHHNDKLLERAEKFLHVPGYEKMPLFYIWGHSFEFERENTWPLMEQLAEKLHGAQDIWYATNGQIADYLTALRSTRESADGKRLYNPSAQPIWFVADGKVRVAEPGKLCEI